MRTPKEVVPFVNYLGRVKGFTYLHGNPLHLSPLDFTISLNQEAKIYSKYDREQPTSYLNDYVRKIQVAINTGTGRDFIVNLRNKMFTDLTSYDKTLSDDQDQTNAIKALYQLLNHYISTNYHLGTPSLF